MSPLIVLFFFFHFLLARFIAVVSIVSIVLYVFLALWPPVLQFRLPASLFVSVFIRFVFVLVLSGEPKQNQGRGLVDRKLVQAPSNFYCWPSQGGSSVLVLW